MPSHGHADARDVRSDGATAVVGNQIYLLGGNAKAAATAGERFSAVVDIFDTSAGKWSTGTSMTAGRMGHSAASDESGCQFY